MAIAVAAGGSAASIMQFYTNFIYNFGLVYDAIKNIILFFLGSPRPFNDTPFSVGDNLGSVIYYLLFSA